MSEYAAINDDNPTPPIPIINILLFLFLYKLLITIPKPVGSAQPSSAPTFKLIDFVDKAKNGHYELSDHSIEEVQKLIRVRLPVTSITNKECKPKMNKCNLIVHLNKNHSDTALSANLVEIDLENLSIKTTESCLFELDHFIEAYKISSLIESKISNIMDDSSNKIRDITLKAFSHAEGHLELNFSNFLDTAEAKDLIDMYLDEA